MKRNPKKKLRFLIAYGPTQEPIDPVRYISNYSTGVMGKNLVAQAKKRGHLVESVECPERAQTACQLDELMGKLLPDSDVVIMAAAVADARPARVSGKKIKKEKLRLISLIKNPDILENLSKKKKNKQVFIGFGLESTDLTGNGLKKISNKKLELIVLQEVKKNKKPFGKKAIDAYFLEESGAGEWMKAAHKAQIARKVILKAEDFYALKNSD